MALPNYQNEIEKEIDKIQTSIENLNIKILREKQDLNQYKIRKNRSIKKCHTKIALKKSQITVLSNKTFNIHIKEQSTSSSSDTEPSTPTPNSETETDTFELLIPPNWDTRDPKRLIAWQLERHIHWATKNPPWTSRSNLHEILDLRTAAELLEDAPPGRGNRMLDPKYCRLDPGDEKWGKPAAALLAHAKGFYKDPEGWMLMDLPRTLLIAMEAWFFELGERERGELPANANDWQDLPDSVTSKWNQAFAVGKFLWE
ncbi:hypothetical protein N7520_006809 [Penicillium odoratum]|uniref:uncharacterized protein n=1 Tax=Penicillium odoratum TaxID=1167516 RepID=UPI002547300A|nr:uncharacterized protein N7520_006809 [Penicillium odoratum]KAJ5759653.1 hypothetical protein N7520_006809 [Penicillium odoratum]